MHAAESTNCTICGEALSNEKERDLALCEQCTDAWTRDRECPW